MSAVMEEVKVETKETKPKRAEPKKVRLTIASGEADSDKGDVVLVHNFKQILIQRDKEVLVDDVFVEVLKHATVHSAFKDESGVMRSATVPRYSYQVSPV